MGDGDGCATDLSYVQSVLNNLKRKVNCSEGESLFAGLTFSDSVSSAEVASSSNNILGSLTRALAMATLCFCPPES